MGLFIGGTPQVPRVSAGILTSEGLLFQVTPEGAGREHPLFSLLLATLWINFHALNDGVFKGSNRQ